MTHLEDGFNLIAIFGAFRLKNCKMYVYCLTAMSFSVLLASNTENVPLKFYANLGTAKKSCKKSHKKGRVALAPYLSLHGTLAPDLRKTVAKLSKYKNAKFRKLQF
jgi:hypothetical protein